LQLLGKNLQLLSKNLQLLGKDLQLLGKDLQLLSKPTNPSNGKKISRFLATLRLRNKKASIERCQRQTNIGHTSQIL
jgi:hypothetical protein